MGAENIVSIPWGQEKITTTTRREHSLGALGVTPDGRWFRWAFSDGALGSGTLLAAAAHVANHQNIAVQAAAAVGAQTVSVTLGATAATLNQYEDGYLMTRDGAGEGHLYRIRSNPAAALSATLVVTLQQGDDVREALTTASEVSLQVNLYRDVVTAPTTATGVALGWAPEEIADNTYFWLQVGGLVSGLIDGTVVIGQMVERSPTVAGAVSAVDYSGTAERHVVGAVHGTVSADTDYGFILAKLL